MNVSQLIETSLKASRLASVDPAERQIPSSGHPMAVLTLRPEETHQRLIGFGAALTESAALVLNCLRPEDREQVLADHFGPGGHRYQLARTHLNSCDFSERSWALVERPGDLALDSFSMAEPDRHIVPLIQAAQRLAGGGLNLMVTPWSPPGWMKSNGSMVQGGQLLPAFRGAWADTFVRFILELRNRGIEVWSLTVQNEPAAVQRWDSCLWSAEEEADFVVEYLRPRLAAQGLSHIKILVWDHNRELLWDRASASLSRPGARQAIDGLAFHWYSGDQYDQVSAVAQAWPEKLLVFTEGCIEGGPRMGEWFSGERYAHNILGDLNAGTHGWIDWNLALDTRGGPNHANNFCDAPVLVDVEAKKAHYQSSYWYLGHFSRFLPPGSFRVGSTPWVGWVPASADGRGAGMVEFGSFRNPQGQLVVIALNRTEAPLGYQIKAGEGERNLLLPPRAIHTVILD